MSFTGHILDGQVVLDAPAALPNGTPVLVEPSSNGVTPEQADVPTIFERMKEFIGCIEDSNLPTDGALNHDHYLYGTPKKSP